MAGLPGHPGQTVRHDIFVDGAAPWIEWRQLRSRLERRPRPKTAKAEERSTGVQDAHGWEGLRHVSAEDQEGRSPLGRGPGVKRPLDPAVSVRKACVIKAPRPFNGSQERPDERSGPRLDTVKGGQWWRRVADGRKPWPCARAAARWRSLPPLGAWPWPNHLVVAVLGLRTGLAWRRSSFTLRISRGR